MAGLLAVLIVAATVIVTRTFDKTPPASLPAGDDTRQVPCPAGDEEGAASDKPQGTGVALAALAHPPRLDIYRALARPSGSSCQVTASKNPVVRPAGGRNGRWQR